MKLHYLALILAAGVLALAAVNSSPTPSARPVVAWDYEKMKDAADLIVIATPLVTRDLKEKTTLPGIEEIGPDNQSRPVAAVGVETNFEIQTTLKGETPLNRFFLHHLRLANPPAVPAVNGPQLAAFDSAKKVRYLMFLKKEPDGHYVSVTGQTDPAIAIFPLGTYP